MTVHADAALSIFPEKANCAQSVLYSYAPELNLDPNLALAIASGFGGGMGRKQEVCGAVSGGIMVLGIVYSKGEWLEGDHKDKIYAEVQAFIGSFIKKHGTICCRDLLNGCSLLTPEGRQRFHDEDLLEQCREYVRTACEILDERI
jgi:C_GCAxxG_C_C family probable redox protein